MATTSGMEQGDRRRSSVAGLAMSLLLVSLLAGATGVVLAWFKAKHAAGSAVIEAACSPEAKKLVQLEDRVSTVVDVASIITNLAGEGAPWVRLDVSVVMSVPVSNKDKIAAVLAQDFMGFMRSLKPEQLVGGSNLLFLKQDLSDIARTRTADETTEVLIRNLIIE